MKRIATLIILLLLVATSASAMILAGVLSSYRAPQAPNAPTGVTATAGNTQNTVNWSAGATDATHDAPTSYILYGGTSASPTSSIYTGSATSYTHTGLTNDTPYYYRLTASNAAGTSGYSSPDATATPNVPVDGGAYSINLTAANFPSSELNAVVAGTGASTSQGATGLSINGASGGTGTVYGVYKHYVVPDFNRTYTISFVPASGSLTPFDLVSLVDSDGTWGYSSQVITIRMSAAGSSDSSGSYINITKWGTTGTKTHVANTAYTGGATYKAKLIFTATTVTVEVYNSSNTLLITSGAIALNTMYHAKPNYGLMLYSSNWNPGLVRILDFSVN